MENKQKNSRKRLNSLILLVAFTAVMLIVSTYAWFSAQKNVTISGLTGVVNVAEGLQISLDAATWANTINLADFTDTDQNGVWEGGSKYFADSSATFQTPYSGGENITPGEMLPVSTTAGTNEGIGLPYFNMYNGINEEGKVLHTITNVADTDSNNKADKEAAENGYFAFDVFLQNSTGEVDASYIGDILQLEPNSTATATKDSTGLQNTLRVGFALYQSGSLDVNDTPTADEIIAALSGKNIDDVAIWEPNAYGSFDGDDSDTDADLVAHVPNIVNSNNMLTLSEDDKTQYNTWNGSAWTGAFDADDRLYTYALTQKSIDAETDVIQTFDGIKDIYDWSKVDTVSGNETRGLRKQVTLQTPVSGTGDNPLKLISIEKNELLNDGDHDNDPANTFVTMKANEILKMRIYVWLEGQDVDCTNYASLGQGVNLDIGFSKPGSDNNS